MGGAEPATDLRHDDATKPMNDERQAAFRELITRAKARGFFVDADLAELLPERLVPADQVEDVRNMLMDLGLAYGDAAYAADPPIQARPSLEASSQRYQFDDREALPLDEPCTGSDPLVVMAVGAEGGSLRLVAQRTTVGWRYRYTLVDQCAAWLEEGDAESRRQSPWVDSWRDALAQLDRYPWARLHPIDVHPAFTTRVLDAARRRLENQRSLLDRWTRLTAPRS